ncbi:MAG: Asp-tRNA(Asn)/Glu-tRNA(Gln) amidotransferase subunit GatB, partial [Burkholderiales bacterium]
RKPGGPLGTRREIKNLNSFRFLQQAIEFEANWQMQVLEDGGRIEQATVLFDADKGQTRVMRTKEDAHDYRYFPDPDLLPVEIDPSWIEQVAASLPELPGARQARYCREYGLSNYDASMLTASRETADYFERLLAVLPEDPKLCANWLKGELSARLNREDLDIERSPVTAAALGGLLIRIADGSISGKIAKDVFDAMWAGEGSADEIIASKGLKQISDGDELGGIVDRILVENARQVADYKSGKEKAFQSLVGQVMKATRGKANPAQVNEILRRKLS